MNSKIVIIIIGILVILLGGIGFRSMQGKSEPGSDTIVDTISSQPVLLHHSYVNGIHRYRGAVNLPTPCYELVAESQVAESFPEQVSINLMSDEMTGYCVQMISGYDFDVMAPASEKAIFSGLYLDGVLQEITLNEEERDDGVTIEDVATSTDEDVREVENRDVSTSTDEE